MIITDNKLRWDNLKKGDLIRNRKTGKVRRVSRIDRNDWRGFHIFVKEGYWLNDFELEQWEKVEK